MPRLPLERPVDWPRRLSGLLRRHETLPFRWGVNDCFIFAFDSAVRDLTGLEVLPNVVRPTSALAAERWLRAHGHADTGALATSLLGPPLPTPRLMGRGDLAALPSDRGAVTLGVCVGSSVAYPATYGLSYVPRSIATAAWRV